MKHITLESMKAVVQVHKKGYDELFDELCTIRPEIETKKKHSKNKIFIMKKFYSIFF